MVQLLRELVSRLIYLLHVIMRTVTVNRRPASCAKISPRTSNNIRRTKICPALFINGRLRSEGIWRSKPIVRSSSAVQKVDFTRLKVARIKCSNRLAEAIMERQNGRSWNV